MNSSLEPPRTVVFALCGSFCTFETVLPQIIRLRACGWEVLPMLSYAASALDTLSPREREIITLRFGLGGGKEQTQKEVADRLGISQSYISRLEKRIIQRLKKEILRLS